MVLESAMPGDFLVAHIVYTGAARHSTRERFL